MNIIESSSRLNKAFEYLKSHGKIHTQKDLANIMNSTPATVSKALSGDSKALTERFLRRFNHAFGEIFDIQWLLGEDDAEYMLIDSAMLQFIPVYYSEYRGDVRSNGEDWSAKDPSYIKICFTPIIKWHYFSLKLFDLLNQFGALRTGLVRELWMDYERSYENGEAVYWKLPKEILINYGLDTTKLNKESITPTYKPEPDTRTTNKGLIKEDDDNDYNESDYVPLLPIEAMAGSLQGLSEGVELRNCRKIKSPVAGADWAIQISGDSMEPDFKNGSILFIKKITSRMIPWGHPLVIDTYDGVVFKKIFPDDEEYIEARSINPDYPPFHIEKSIVLGLYRVLGGTFINSTI